MTSKRIRAAAAISLLGVMLLLLRSVHRSGHTTPDLTDSRAEISRRLATSENISSVPSQTNPSEPSRRPASIVPPPDYESEDFTHVPDWMPRPGNALSARAEDASLRSDGFVEGTLRFGFGANQTDALHEITNCLKAAGMEPGADGFSYASEDPPRRCEVRVESAPDGGMTVKLVYQGTDHDKGCHCPTCGSSPENPKS